MKVMNFPIKRDQIKWKKCFYILIKCQSGSKKQLKAEEVIFLHDSVINVMKQLSCKHGSARLRQVVHDLLGDVMRQSGLNCTSENSFRWNNSVCVRAVGLKHKQTGITELPQGTLPPLPPPSFPMLQCFLVDCSLKGLWLFSSAVK